MSSKTQNKIQIYYESINPNFFFRKLIKNELPNSKGFSDKFEVFTYPQDNNQYILTPDINSYHLYIINIIDDSLLSILKCHENTLSNFGYFENKENNKNQAYIISYDISGVIVVWDVNNNFSIKHKIETNQITIYNCIILFNINKINNNYIISSNSCDVEEENQYSKIYNLENGKFIKNIFETNLNRTYFLIYWKNLYNNKNYIIELCFEKISIIEMFSNKKYHDFFSAEEAFTSGFIKEDNLFTSSMFDVIKIWNLKNLYLSKKIYCGNGYNLQSMLKWNDNYVIISDNNQYKAFKIVDIKNCKIISYIGGKHNAPIICIKRIKSSLYGDCLLTSATDGKIILWTC